MAYSSGYSSGGSGGMMPRRSQAYSGLTSSYNPTGTTSRNIPTRSSSLYTSSPHRMSRPRSYAERSSVHGGLSSMKPSYSYGSLNTLDPNLSLGSYASKPLSVYGSASYGYGSPSSAYSSGSTSSYGGLPISSTLNAYSSTNYGLSSSPTSYSASGYSSSPTSNYLSSYSPSSSGGSASYRQAKTPRSSSSSRTSASRPSSGLSSLATSRSNSASSLKSDISEGYASGGDRSGRSSRLGSASSGGGDTAANSHPESPSRSVSTASENGELDYKKLYEESLSENERLREKLRKTEDELSEARSKLEKVTSHSMRNSLSETEKRERRAMERKLSEMEEELKQLQKLKAENEKLKAENRALTRVVSKLTNSANATK